MAAVSPVIINSSPQSFRIPSISPPSVQRSAQKLNTSSPQLPSPSTFVKPRVSKLKTGSKAQPIPTGVSEGFASVGSLWRSKIFNVEEPSNEKEGASAPGYGDQRAAPKTGGKRDESSGKLKKPGRAKNKESSEILSQSPARKYYENKEATTTRELCASSGAKRDVYDVPAKHPSRDIPEIHTSNLPLSEYAFAVSKDQSGAGALEKLHKRSKKSVDISVKPRETNISPAKKPRKRKTKSEAIVLNSDDPEARHEPETLREQKKVKPSLEEFQHADVKPKAKKSAVKKVKKNPASASAQKDKSDAGKGKTAVKTSNEVKVSTAALEKSMYFDKQAGLREPPEHATPILPVNPQTEGDMLPDALATAENARPMEKASRRRRSWTPAKDTTIVNLACSRPPTAGSEVSNTSHSPRLQLTDILGKYGYACTETGQTVPGLRTSTGEAMTKKRRIELADAATPNASKPKAVAGAATKPAKVAKVPKKPQTITAMATAAFLPAKKIDIQQDTVSAFFAAGGQTATIIEHETSAANLLDQPPLTEKPKKPRKPRTKKSTAADDAEKISTATISKKPRGRKRTKTVKIDEADPRPRLYSPVRATAQIKKQDFLFGTSSQLAPAESPELIRDLQAALRESEKTYSEIMDREDCASQALPSSGVATSPHEKSFMKVPTAPHGTCLSVEQAEKQLWCIAARDFAGAVFRRERDGTSPEDGDKNLLDNAVEEVETPLLVKMDLEPEINVDCAVIKHCTSVLFPLENDETVQALEDERQPDDARVNETLSAPLPSAQDGKGDDSWMILHSDDSDPALLQPGAALISNAATNSVARMPTSPEEIQPVFKFASPRMFRPILYPLDSNANLIRNASPAKTSAFGQTRAVSSTASDPSRNIKRPRRQSLKDKGPAVSIAKSPKKRGRPPRLPVAASSPPRSKLTTTKGGASMSQSAAKSEWMDVDEISDSDAPTTPSPPRRRASSSPPAMRPLVLSPSNPRPVSAEASVEFTGLTIKPDGPQWPSMKDSLFRRITEIVKHTPRSTESGNLSWWEKILLYDPIVVEDLTHWLNEEGLRVETRRQKANEKGKKRKKSGTDHKENEVEISWELREDLLQPWMVQKWCEEKSICCYLKDGGWRGRRTT